MIGIFTIILICLLTTVGSLSIIISLVTEREYFSQYIPTQPTLNATNKHNELDKDIVKYFASDYFAEDN